jgi:hypothetical protein
VGEDIRVQAINTLASELASRAVVDGDLRTSHALWPQLDFDTRDEIEMRVRGIGLAHRRGEDHVDAALDYLTRKEQT